MRIFFIAVLFLVMSFGSFAAQTDVLRVQTGTTTFSTTSDATVTIPTTLADITKSVLTFSVRVDGTLPALGFVGGKIASTSTLYFKRSSTSSTVTTVTWTITEFTAGVTVQRGEVLNPPDNFVDVPITTVNLSKSFPIMTGYNAGTGAGGDDFYTATLTSTTNLQLYANNTAFDGLYWQVVTIDECNVQTVTATLGTGVTTNTATISSVNVAKTMTAAFGFYVGGTIPFNEIPYCKIEDSTTVRFTRLASGNSISCRVYIVEFTGIGWVQSGIKTSSATSETEAILAVNTETSIATIQGIYGTLGYSDSTGSNFACAEFNGVLTNSTTVTLTRTSNADAGAVAWQVIDFEGTPPASGSFLLLF